MCEAVSFLGGFARLNVHINKLRIEQFKDLGFRFDRWFIVLVVLLLLILILVLLLSNAKAIN